MPHTARTFSGLTGELQIEERQSGLHHVAECLPGLHGREGHNFIDSPPDMLFTCRAVHFGQVTVNRQISKIGVKERHPQRSIFHEAVQQLEPRLRRLQPGGATTAAAPVRRCVREDGGSRLQAKHQSSGGRLGVLIRRRLLSMV